VDGKSFITGGALKGFFGIAEEGEEEAGQFWMCG
jgi:hypothetical protein